MGIYYSRYENPCPICNEGVVNQTFISVSPMTVSRHCTQCDARDFTEEQLKALGDTYSIDWSGNRLPDWSEWTTGLTELD